MIQNYLLVMVGGALGAAARYGVGRLCANITMANLPAGTFAVNIVGCFVLGFLTAFGESHTAIPRGVLLMLTGGFCGAFTTFSTFSGETIKLLEEGQWASALTYVAASLVLGLLFFVLGKNVG